MVYIIEETDIYKKLNSDEEREKYCEVYLKGIAELTYLEVYNTLDANEPLEKNLQPAYKTMLGISFLKNSIFNEEKPHKGKSEGYKDFIYQSQDTLNIITNYINKSASRNEVQEFFN